LISQGIHPLWGVKQVRGVEKLFSSQYHSPDGADIASFFVFRHMEL